MAARSPSHPAMELSMTPLRQRMIEDMQVRNLSSHTQRAYIQQISQFARHFGKSPASLGVEEIRLYQVYLTNERRLASSSIQIVIAALRFLYRVTLKKEWAFTDVIPSPKSAAKLPVVLSPDEVLRFLACVDSVKHRAILTSCYAAGLRISEAVCLKVTGIDSRRMVIRVAHGKGRRTAMSCSRQSCSILYAATGEGHDRGSGSSPVIFPASRSRDSPWPAPPRKHAGVPASPSPSRLIPSATPLPFICSRPGPTSEPSSFCLVIAT
jgi:site-specific recombinase XerD